MSDVCPIRVKLHVVNMLQRYLSLLCHPARFQAVINRTDESHSIESFCNATAIPVSIRDISASFVT
jgi:hypothetical protein